MQAVSALVIVLSYNIILIPISSVYIVQKRLQVEIAGCVLLWCHCAMIVRCYIILL